jgi:hypothetical protein
VILNSLSSKYLQNNLENKTLAAYENLYDYRFDDTNDDGIPDKANYYGPDATFNFPTVGTKANSTGLIPYDPSTTTRRIESDAAGNVKKVVNKYPSQQDIQNKELDIRKKAERLPFLRRLFD